MSREEARYEIDRAESALASARDELDKLDDRPSVVDALFVSIEEIGRDTHVANAHVSPYPFCGAAPCRGIRDLLEHTRQELAQAARAA